ncbi:hypothetical protein ACIOFV_50305 [Streptomyces mirabilis]|uniref:hypothetical protein n=1 Tax=Streptomyces mirabilis TaxID=68239 RepID=UPI0037F2FF1F
MGDDTNVINLRPRNTASPGLPPLLSEPPSRPAVPPPDPDPGSGTVSVPVRNRRSAADSLAAVPVTLPPVTGHVPATFRADGLDGGDDDQEEIGMGTLGLAAILAVALAALRGTAGALTDWRQRRMERAAEAEPLRAARLKLQEAQLKTEQAAADRGKAPSSQDYGRRTLNRSGGGSSGGGSGGGRGGGSGGDSRKQSPSGSGGTGSGSGGSGGGRKNGGGKPGAGGGLLNGGSPKNGKGGGSGGGKSPGSGGSGGSGKGSGGSGSGSDNTTPKPKPKKPGALGQLLLDRSKRRTAREAADQQAAARQQKADLKQARKNDPGSGDGKGGKDKGGKDDASPKSSGVDLTKGPADPSTPTSGGGDERVTLGRAIVDETVRRAQERLNKRRTDPDPAAAQETGKDDDDSKPDAGPAAAEGAAAPDSPDSQPKPGPEGEGAQATAGDPAAEDPGGSAPGGGWDHWTPPRQERRNAWDSLFDAMWEPQVVWTAEQVDPPGAHARSWEPAALGRAPAGPPAASAPAATAAATTTLTKEAPPMSGLIPMPSPGRAAAQHLTEVTLDDVLEGLTESKDRCFATYDETAVLADKARKLRDALADLALELSEAHNVIGQLTALAMARLAESMDLLARKADEMRAKSLVAAELVEIAHDEMHNAYKPVQHAAADAGLVMPSARIHNED